MKFVLFHHVLAKILFLYMFKIQKLHCLSLVTVYPCPYEDTCYASSGINAACTTSDYYACGYGSCCKCPTGKIPVGAIGADCKSCEGGQYESSPGTCSSCPSGKYSLPDTSDCTDKCNFGFYCDGFSRLCAVGSYSLSTISFYSSCTACQAGFFSDYSRYSGFGGQWFPMQVTYTYNGATYNLTFDGTFIRDIPRYATSDYFLEYGGVGGYWYFGYNTPPRYSFVSHYINTAPVGTFDNPAITDQEKHEAVKYLMNTWTHSICLACPINYSSTGSGAKPYCSRCTGDGFTAATGSASCITCPNNKYFNYQTQICSSCPVGKIQKSPWYHPAQISYIEPIGGQNFIMEFRNRYTVDGLPVFENITYDVAIWFNVLQKAWYYYTRTGFNNYLWIGSFQNYYDKMYISTSINTNINVDALNYWNGRSTWCLPCAQGTYNDQVEQTVCSQCSPGRSSDSGSTYCYVCNSGSFSPVSGSSSCVACSRGTFNSQSGQTSCSFCNSGTTSEPGSSSCYSCVPGKFASASGSTVCETCTPECPYFTSVQCNATTNRVCCNR